jgi:sensor domain CHASE-containing protein
MFRTTRNQIALIISIFCFMIVAGFVLMKLSNQQKIDLLISEMQLGKATLLEKMIEFESKDLLTFTYDYTYWDDMVTFVKNGDKQWAKENIETSVSTFNIDYVWVYRPDLMLVYSFTREGNELAERIPLTDDNLVQISKLERLQHFFINANNELIEVSIILQKIRIEKPLYKVISFQDESGQKNIWMK